MFRFKPTTAFLFLTVTLAQAQHTDVINSNRPGESQSAFSVGQTVFQAETGIYGFQEEHSLLGVETNGIGLDLNLRYGAFMEQLEFNLELQHQWDAYNTALGSERRSMFRQINLGAKYLVYDPNRNYVEKRNIHSWKANQKFRWRQFIPALAVYAGANINFDNPYLPPNEGSITPKVMVITQNQFSGGYVLVMNIIGDRMTSEFPSYGYVVTLTKGFNEKWSGFLENQGFMSDWYADSILRGGAAYLIKENIQVDASISSNFKDTPSVLYGGIGLSWRFDQNYQPVLIRSGKEEGKDDKKKKEKKDKKKRKDEIEIETEKP